jgi:hypothetical protein
LLSTGASASATSFRSVDSAGHHARRAHLQRTGRFEELRESRGPVAHQQSVRLIGGGVARIADVRQPGIPKAVREVARQERTVREARDLIEVPPAEFDEVRAVVGSQ